LAFLLYKANTQYTTTREIEMATIKIDDKIYDVDDLSEESKAQVLSLNFVDAELNRLQLKVAAMQTARNAYASALNALLGEDEDSAVETSEDD
jgi:hypothetical protein